MSQNFYPRYFLVNIFDPLSCTRKIVILYDEIAVITKTVKGHRWFIGIYYDRKIERAQRDNFEVSEVILKRYGQIILLLFWSKVHENLHISTLDYYY